jgi:nucleoside-diphosphate-sugar epimerase
MLSPQYYIFTPKYNTISFMLKKNIFITGISGCVGHYVWDELKDKPDYHLYLLVRKPERLRFRHELLNRDNVTIIEGSMDHLPRHAELLKTMDAVIHMATDWGGDMNYEHTLGLFKLLDPEKCQKVLYFSTASILGPDNKPIPNAHEIGTSYIWRKWDAYNDLPKLPIYPKIKILFPTLILGGDATHPLSHALNGLPKAIKFTGLFRFLGFDASFHYIHAADIALMVTYLLENAVPEKEFVLGQEPVTFNQAIDILCRLAKKRQYFRVTITPRFVLFLGALFRIKVNSWDRYCLEHPHLRYKATRPEMFGLKSRYPHIEEIFRSALK